MPLLPKLFDLVVIDEASQVSVAQAFPALLRAKQVVVFGDKRQFSNVKSSNASNERNHVYRNDIQEFTRRQISGDAATLARIATFDIKKSVLEFFETCRNFEIMLLKHFRGYQEHISFSSRYFYDNQLQAIKIRTLPIDQVIRFDTVTPAPADRQLRNVNEAEARFILNALVKLLADEDPPSVCVITPFREQQQYISRLMRDHERGEDLRTALKLKVMTFDTCQGIEREIVMYSMVEAPGGRSMLNYIFPVDVDKLSEDVEEKLKAQRLNVGLSRAQEVMWFVLSKPITDYKGSAGTALRHYHNLLQSDDMAEGLRAESPMELKALNWLKQTAFVQKNAETVRIFEQFPISRYLRQLDPRYRHPNWRVDFLLIYESTVGPIKIIVEYDGFEAHFGHAEGDVDAINYESYLSQADLERQLTLEQYGYRFIRLNRFNLGRDPVAAINDMIERVIKNARVAEPDAIGRIRVDAEGLAEGTRKRCSRCNEVKLTEQFYDYHLRGGLGGFGRICAACKTGGALHVSGLGGFDRSWRSRRRR